MVETFTALGLMFGLVSIMVVPQAIMRIRDIHKEKDS